jgi:hypothetical protein
VLRRTVAEVSIRASRSRVQIRNHSSTKLFYREGMRDQSEETSWVSMNLLSG